MKLAEEQLHIQRDLAVEVGSAASLRDAGALSVFGALELINADCGGVCLLNEDTGSLEHVYSEGFSNAMIRGVFETPYRRLLWKVLKDKAPVEIFFDDPVLNKINYKADENLLYILFYPFVHQDRCFGALAVGSHSRTLLPSFEKSALESLTAQIANIIRQKQIEEAYRISEKRYRGLFASMLHGVIQIDECDRFIDCNAAFQEMTGYKLSELRKMNAQDITPEKWQARDTEIMSKQVIQKGYSEEYEKEYIRRDGTLIPVSVRVWINEDEFGKREYWAVVRDITEKKKNERTISRMIHDLSHSNTELQQFAYAASHDLQEPLRAMTGFSELLLRNHGNALDGEGREFIAYIIDAASRMQQLIEDLLSYSRLHTRAKPFEQVDLNKVLDTVLLNLTLSVEESGADVEYSDLPVVVCDRQQIVQLFQNLVGNAIKYRKPDEPPRVKISAVERPRTWEFTVSDNGIGIKEEFKEVIFHMFQRLHSREEYSGTGIGLALCRRIVERHGGTIWAESEYGIGTRFYFTLRKDPEKDRDAG
jgi:PAS domain S-box-containing protein